MGETEYQIMTDGNTFRVCSIRKGCFGRVEYRWEDYHPYQPTYEAALEYIRRNYGHSARIVSRPWRPA